MDPRPQAISQSFPNIFASGAGRGLAAQPSGAAAAPQAAGSARPAWHGGAPPKSSGRTGWINEATEPEGLEAPLVTLAAPTAGPRVGGAPPRSASPLLLALLVAVAIALAVALAVALAGRGAAAGKDAPCACRVGHPVRPARLYSASYRQ